MSIEGVILLAIVAFMLAIIWGMTL